MRINFMIKTKCDYTQKFVKEDKRTLKITVHMKEVRKDCIFFSGISVDIHCPGITVKHLRLRGIETKAWLQYYHIC